MTYMELNFIGDYMPSFRLLISVLILLFSLWGIASSEGIFKIVHKKAKNFALYNVKMDKRKILSEELKSLADKEYLLINFTSYTCRPCIKEIPELETLVQQKEKHRLWIIYTDADRKKIKKSVKKIRIKSTVLVDALGFVSRKFTIKKIPTTLIIDRNMTIRAITTGYSHKNMKQLKAML